MLCDPPRKCPPPFQGPIAEALHRWPSEHSPPRCAPIAPRLHYLFRGLVTCTLFLFSQPVMPEDTRTEIAALTMKLGQEPVACLTISDSRELSRQLAQTHLAKIIQDERYGGRQALVTLLSEYAGANIQELWTRLRPLLMEKFVVPDMA